MEKKTGIKISSELLLADNGEEVLPADHQGIDIFLDVLKKGDISYSKQHWHSTLQINVVFKGTLSVMANGELLEIHEDEGIIINSNVLHCMNPGGVSSGLVYSFNIHPYAICSEKDLYLYNKYVTALLSAPDFTYLVLKKEVPWQAQILNLLTDSFFAADHAIFAYELILKRNILDVWTILLQNYQDIVQKEADALKEVSLLRLKVMISYIDSHYGDKITLSSIADSANISISECNRCFNKYLKQPPMSYVKQARIIRACKYLTSSDKKIQEISDLLGFSDISHFYRTFIHEMNITPKEYQKLAHTPGQMPGPALPSQDP